MSVFNANKTETSEQYQQYNVNVVTNEHYAVDKVTSDSASGAEVSCSGGESVNGSLNVGLKRATQNNPVVFGAENAITGKNYYVHGKQIKYTVSAIVADGQESLGTAEVVPTAASTEGIMEGVGTASVKAVPVPPCNFQSWTGDTSYMANPNVQQTTVSGLDKDISEVAHFNCVVSVQDPVGSVVSGTVNYQWVKVDNLHIPAGNGCVKYGYPITQQDIATAQAACNSNYFRLYSAHYERIDDFDGYRYTYHLRGWDTRNGGAYQYPLVLPQYGNNTTVNGLPVGGEIMCVWYDELSDTFKWGIETQSPTINATTGYSTPQNVQAYESGYPLYDGDGQPNTGNFLSNGFSWADVVLGTSVSASGRWFVTSPYGNYPRSTWLVITPTGSGDGQPSYSLDTSRFDVTDPYGQPMVGTSLNINQVLDYSLNDFSKDSHLWFELEREDLDLTTSISGSDYFQTYYNGQVTFTGTDITQLSGSDVTETDPLYITYYDALGVKSVYRKVVTEETYVHQLTGGDLMEADSEASYNNLTTSVTYDFADGECGSFNGWYYVDGLGNRVEVGDGSPHLTISPPNSCCKTFRPDITSCSDKYYPYGFFDGNVYYRYALLPYVDDSTGSWLTPSPQSSIYNIDTNSIINNGIAPYTQDGQGSDDVYFKLNPGETLYYDGLVFLSYVASGASNVGNYKLVGSTRELEEIYQTEAVASYAKVDYIENTTQSVHYYRIGWIGLMPSMVEATYPGGYVSTYGTVYDAFLSGQLFLYVDSMPDEDMYKGLALVPNLVYKNACSLNKSALILTCPIAGDELANKLSMESRYVDYGVTNDVDYDAASTLYRWTKAYEEIVSQTSYVYGANTNMVNWALIGSGRVNDYNIVQEKIYTARGVRVSWPEHQNAYYINNFDGFDFGFELETCVPVSPYLFTEYTYDPNTGVTTGVQPQNTTGNYPDTMSARSAKMSAGKFLSNQNNNKMVLLTAANLSTYTDPNTFTISADTGEYSLFDGGINDRFILDSTPTYELGHYVFGTNETSSATYGMWWPMNNGDLMAECSSKNIPTYHLADSGSSYSSLKKYILIENGSDGQQKASYYEWSANEWVEYNAFPCLIDTTGMSENDELIILRKIETIENPSAIHGGYVIHHNGYQVPGTSVYKDEIRPWNESWPYYDDGSVIVSDPDNHKYCEVVNTFIGNSGVVVYVDSNLVQRYQEYGYFFGGANLGAYHTANEVTSAEELLGAFENEVRFILVNTTDGSSGIVYDGVTYTSGHVYRLNIKQVSEISSGVFYQKAHEYFSNGSYEGKTTQSEVDFALDNGVYLIPIKDSPSAITIQDFYCTSTGFDKNGDYIGIPIDNGGVYSPYCNTITGYSNQGVFRNLLCDCASDASFMPRGMSDCTYERNITYNSDYGYYEVSKRGFYVGNDFVEVPSDGSVKWLRLNDEGIHRKLIDTIINGTESEKVGNYYNLTAPLHLDGSQNPVVANDSYDYVLYEGSSTSGAVDVADNTAFASALSNHTPLIRVTTDLYVPFDTNSAFARKYEGGRYYKLNYNYFYRATLTSPDYPSSMAGTYDFDFLGWMVDGAPVYEVYCDANGNGITGTMDFPFSDEYVIYDSGYDFFDTVYINGVYSSQNDPFELVTGLTNYTVVQNSAELDDCLFGVVPFKVTSYDGNDLTGADSYTYADGEFYEPNKWLLSTAIKYKYPFFMASETMDYRGAHYDNGTTYINKAVFSTIYTEADVSRVLDFGAEYVMVADYRYDENPSGDVVTITGMDDLMQAIANRSEAIYINTDDGEPLSYRYMQYAYGSFYTLNRVVIKGSVYQGGDVLRRKVDYRFFPVNETVSVLPCETATAVYAYNFKIDFCVRGGECTPTISNGQFGTFYTYDGNLVTYSQTSLLDPNDVLSLDHRHFTGHHVLSFSVINGYDNNTVYDENAANNKCRRMAGYVVGKECRKDYQGVTIEIDPDAINDIRTFMDGILPSCENALTAAGSCDSKIVTNNPMALFGIEADGESTNPSYPNFDYLSYVEMGLNGVGNATYYEWDENSGSYQIVSSLEPGVGSDSVYHLLTRWEDGSYALKRRISVGLYKVTIEEAVGVDIATLNSMDIRDFGDVGSASLIPLCYMTSFAPYLTTGDAVAAYNDALHVWHGLPFVVRPNTLYKASYTKVYDLNASLQNTEDIMQLFMTIYDVSTAPASLQVQNYVIINTYPMPQNVVNVSSADELEAAVLANVQCFMNTSAGAITYNGITYTPNQIYGNLIYYGGPSALINGNCVNPFVRYVTGFTVKLNTPIITSGNNQVSIDPNNTGVTGLEVRYTIDGTTPNPSSLLYTGTFALDGSTSPVTIKAIATAGVGYVDSDVATHVANYILSAPLITVV